MTRKTLRDWALCKNGEPFFVHPAIAPKDFYRDIRAFERAVREESAKVADVHAKGFAEFATRVASKGHNVDDIVARRIASEDIATAIRRKK